MAQCEAVRPNGARCRIKALEGSKYCQIHSKLAEGGPEEGLPEQGVAAGTVEEELSVQTLYDVAEPQEEPTVEEVAEEAPVEEPAPPKEEKPPVQEVEKKRESPLLGGDSVRVINKSSTKKKRIRYIGKGTYIIASLGISLGPKDYGEVIEVDQAFWERMHTNSDARASFEEA